jgi:hypothetical protein
VAALREGSTTFGLDGVHSLSFDCAGRLIRAFWERRSIRRSLDNRFVEKLRVGSYPWSHARREPDSSERWALCETIFREMSAIQASLAAPVPGLPEAPVGDLRVRVKDILGWNAEALEADAVRFRSVYLPIPILPPDQYGALVVQLAEGCSYNQCTLCRFYRDRPFRAKSAGEPRAHIRAVREFFGEGLPHRRSVFLADANALALPFPRLLEAFKILREELPLCVGTLRGVYSFTDAFSRMPKSVADFRVLADAGLRRVYLGLESGCDDLLRFLDKPATAAEALDLVSTLKRAGVHVGIIVMVGIGGERYADRHVGETLAVMNAVHLTGEDIVYLSPLAAGPDSPSRHREQEAAIRPLMEAEMEVQLRTLRAGLCFDPRGQAKLAVFDIPDFVY